MNEDTENTTQHESFTLQITERSSQNEISLSSDASLITNTHIELTDRQDTSKVLTKESDTNEAVDDSRDPQEIIKAEADLIDHPLHRNAQKVVIKTDSTRKENKEGEAQETLAIDERINVKKCLEENIEKSFYHDCLKSGYFVLDDEYAGMIMQTKIEKRKRNLIYGLQAVFGILSVFYILPRKRYKFRYLLALAIFNSISNIITVINDFQIVELIATNRQFLSFGALTLINEGIFVLATNVIFIIYLHTFHLFSIRYERIMISGTEDKEEHERLQKLSLDNTIRRLQINQNFFFFDFCFPNHTLKKLSNQIIKKLVTSRRMTTPSSNVVEKMSNSYSGYELSFIILRNHPVYLYEILKKTWPRALFLTFITFVLVLLVDQTFTLSFYQHLITFASLSVSMSAMTLIWDSTDLIEKINSLAALAQLITLEKALLFITADNFIPPIDVTCPFSLQTWNYCRKIVFNYKKGLSQTFDLITLLLAIPSLSYIIQVFEAMLISDRFNNETIEGIKKFSSSRLVLVAIFFLIIIRRLYLQMKINAFFLLYRQKLMKLKETFVQLLSFQEHFINSPESQIKDKSISLIINIFKTKNKSDDFPSFIKESLSKQNEVIEKLTEEIDFEREYFSFKFLGLFTATPMAFRYVLLFAGPFLGTYFWNQLRLVLATSS